jgi:DNA-directed RNA polymerase sigma subunit (sigma70/sigma32)
MTLDANLQWWLAVTRVVELETEQSQRVFRMRLEGNTLDECRLALVDDGVKGITRERVRQMEARVRRRIEESMTPPKSS